MPEAARLSSQTPGPADPWPLRGNNRVLLVQSSPEQLDENWACVEQNGYEVRQVQSGAAADAMIRQWRPDVIVLDACRDREQAAAWAQQLHADLDTTNIPVLAIVSDEQEVLTPGPLESAVDDCLRYPIQRWELLIRIRSLTHLSLHRDELLESRSLHGEQTRMWGVMLDFTRSVAKIANLDALFARIVQSAAEMTCSRRVSLMLPDDQQQYLTIAGAIGLDDDIAKNVQVPVGEAISGQAFRTGRPVTTLDDHEELARRDGYEFRSFVSMPMTYTTMSMVHQRVGVLNVSNRYGDQPFAEWELEFIDLLASIAASAIDDIHARSTRESLLRIERDLQLARQIQFKTFPSELPKLHGIEITAWSEPAEETAGDTYDVIGCRNGAADGAIVLSTAEAERAYLLLADATGHGIGPALSVTQVRAMLRMAVRMKPELRRIARHLNEQLTADLPGGRFVTAWLAEIDAERHTITSFSAGQAPILLYNAAHDHWDVLPADTMPLGITNGLEIVIGEPVRLEPGDIVAVVSDGIIDAADLTGDKFGVEQLLETLSRHRSEGPRQMQLALQAAVDEHTQGAPADDDRTAIILKRTAA